MHDFRGVKGTESVRDLDGHFLGRTPIPGRPEEVVQIVSVF